MPTFQGLVNEEGVISLIEYVKSLTVSAQQANAERRRGGTASVGTDGGEQRQDVMTTTTWLNRRVNYLNQDTA